jgi:Ser/Thr protein kinase RdoA (MazF antagonist)
MKDFNLLTKRGKILRFRKALLKALPRYSQRVDSLEFVAMKSKPVFRIRTKSGSFAAKFHDPSEHLLSQMFGELQFLDHIARHSDLCVETPLANSQGELVTRVESDGLPEVAHVALCSWVLGRRLKDEMSARSYRCLGESSAKLHKLSATFKPGKTFEILKNDRVFYWDKETLLSRVDFKLLPKRRQELFKKGAHIAGKTIRDSWQSAAKPIVIHNDLHPCNIKVHGKRLSIFDFEDIVWGYAGQDIGTAVYHIRFRDDYSELLGAFREGYERVAEWPIESERKLEGFIIARLLMFANYVLNYNIRPHKYLPEYETKLEILLNKNRSS